MVFSSAQKAVLRVLQPSSRNSLGACTFPQIKSATKLNSSELEPALIGLIADNVVRRKFDLFSLIRNVQIIAIERPTKTTTIEPRPTRPKGNVAPQKRKKATPKKKLAKTAKKTLKPPIPSVCEKPREDLFPRIVRQAKPMSAAGVAAIKAIMQANNDAKMRRFSLAQKRDILDLLRGYHPDAEPLLLSIRYDVERLTDG